MSECECGCGCRAKIGPRDPSPDFRGYNCQVLWMASLSQPAHVRRAWRAQQRKWYALVHDLDWSDAIEWYKIDRRNVIGRANVLLNDIAKGKFARVTDFHHVERILAHWRDRDWMNSRFWKPEPWVYHKYGLPEEPLAWEDWMAYLKPVKA